MSDSLTDLDSSDITFVMKRFYFIRARVFTYLCFPHIVSTKTVFYIQSARLSLKLQSETMATAASVTTTNLTTCPICLDLFDNPKSLPCLHAFCLKCLQGQFRNKQPGDKAPCPNCRKEFEIPPHGVRGLQHHFIIQQLIDMLHQRGNSCDKHKDKEVELYCRDCRENVCVICFAGTHRKHDTDLIPEVADSFRDRINDDVRQILSAVGSAGKRSGAAAAEFHGNVEDVKNSILAVGDAVKRSVDSQVNDVLMELQSVILENDKQAESVQEAYQLTLVKVEEFCSDSQELLGRRASDITRAGCELHDRATELLNNDLSSAVKYHPPHVTFTPADVTQVERLNLIGKLTVRTEEQSGISCLLLHHIASRFML